jgi:LacI family transcriptional regulator
VAQLAGVSPAVVSYVLNNGPRPVSTRARAAVEAAVKELGYRPNAIASALRGGSTQSVGFLTPNQRNPFYAELAESIERSFSARGYLVLSGNTQYDRTREERYLHTFVDRKVDGLVFTSGISLATSAIPGGEGVPVMVLDEVRDGSPYSSIGADDAADAGTAVEHLQHHGHQIIGCISGPPHIPVESKRIQGWRAQQLSASAPAGDELLAYAESSEEGGNSAALLLLSEHGRPWAVHGQRPTALFVSSDVQAIGAISACFELGLRVPEDVAIVSFGGTKSAAYTIPPLTTLRQDLEFVAATAVAQLIERIESPGAPVRRTTLRGNLVLGRSCGCEPLQMQGSIQPRGR